MSFLGKFFAGKVEENPSQDADGPPKPKKPVPTEKNMPPKPSEGTSPEKRPPQAMAESKPAVEEKRTDQPQPATEKTPPPSKGNTFLMKMKLKRQEEELQKSQIMDKSKEKSEEEENSQSESIPKTSGLPGKFGFLNKKTQETQEQAEEVSLPQSESSKVENEPQNILGELSEDPKSAPKSKPPFSFLQKKTAQIVPPEPEVAPVTNASEEELEGPNKFSFLSKEEPGSGPIEEGDQTLNLSLAEQRQEDLATALDRADAEDEVSPSKEAPQSQAKQFVGTAHLGCGSTDDQ